MPSNELQQFLSAWDFEARNTLKLLKALPAAKYDFRPDPGGRSLGELAWHLAEIDGYISDGVVSGKFDFNARIPNLERPRVVDALATGYQRVHEDAVARVKKLQPGDMDRKVPFFDGTPMTIRDLLWGALVCHMIHHRGQLSLMCRLAGGVTPGMYGPNREEMAAMRAAQR